MPNFAVAKRGTDSSGRGIYATDYMWGVWEQVCAELGFTPVVTQGSFMVRNGGGADASAGYHDAGGTFDLRVWNLTDEQVAQTIRVLRAHGAAAWLRNPQHGGFTDPHIHFVLGTDQPLSSGAAYQWREYLAGRDGMGGPDYHPRPNPLITEPPEDDMPFTEQQLRQIIREEAPASIREIIREEVAAQFEKEQANGRTLRGNIRAIASKLGVKPIED